MNINVLYGSFPLYITSEKQGDSAKLCAVVALLENKRLNKISREKFWTELILLCCQDSLQRVYV
jgi:hypothetical protein